MDVDGYHSYCTGDFGPEDVVVSGMGGRFPECENVAELRDALISRTPLILPKKMRYGKGAAGMPYDSCGSILNLDKMDNEFFSYPFIMANMMDPGQRKHLEVVYETICDAGYNPTELKRANIGVYNAALSEDAVTLSLNNPEGDGILGLRSMNANRTSYVFDLIGPSYSLDSACSSSATAFWAAVNDMRVGRVDAAIVTGIQLNLSPEFHGMYFTTGVCSLAGNSVPFDANTDGMLRCEAITALFLQKAKFARRVYATVASTKFYSSGYYQEGISVPSRIGQLRAFTDTMEEAGISADDVQYVEAHGTGTQVGDPIEVNSVAEGFHRGRDRPLYLGSIKSNIGHTEASSGICGYIKAILCFETGNILPNFRYAVPNPQCPSLLEGKVIVPMESIPLTSSHIPINSFGLGGTISTTILKHNPKTYSKTPPPPGPLPRLVLFPGTNEEAVKVVFNYIKNNPSLRPEFFALLNKLPFVPPVQKPIRACALYEDWSNPTIKISKMSNTKRRQLWFVMTGMGSQWPGMGLQLMGVEVFANSLKRSAAAAKALGLDLFEILRADRDYFSQQRNITPTFVALAAIQMGLIDILRQLDVKPDGIVGHSAGELLCAYADGCCTIEEVIGCAYWRGKATDISDLPDGIMAAVGLSWEEATRRCPEGIYPACDNADDSVTIAGPTEALERFVEELKRDKVFARTVNTAGYAFHCKYIYPAGEVMRRELKKILTNPRPRSPKWVSSCYSDAECELEESKTFSADYFTHNLLSSVRFKDAVKKIPKNAVTVEIGPHSLLQSILKRIIGPSAAYIGLMKRNDPNNIKYLLESIGRLYMEGVDPQIERLYPPVQFPVPRTTPMINDLIRWKHTQSFHVPIWKPPSTQFTIEVKVDREESFVLDHVIDGRPLFPATGYVELAWRALAHRLDRNHLEMPVVVENFKIHRATFLTASSNPKFNIDLLESTGKFEICEGGSLVASGIIQEAKNLNFSDSEPTHKALESVVPGKEMYNELKMIGYEYGPAFQNLLEVSMEGTEGFVSWNGKWITFLDTLLLFFGFLNSQKGFSLPTGALFFRIDPNVLQNVKKEDKTSTDDVSGIPVKYNPDTGICRTFGVEIAKLALDHAPHRGKDMKPTLEAYTFVANRSKYAPEMKTQEKLSDYMAQCNAAIAEIGKNLQKDFSKYAFPVPLDQSGEEFEFCPSEHRLLRILKDICHNGNDTPTQRKVVFDSYAESVGLDVVNNALLNEDSLKMVLELVLENCYRKINALEVSGSFPLVLSSVAGILKKHVQGSIKSKVIVSSSEVLLEKDFMDEHKIRVQDSLSSFQEHPEDLVIGSFGCGPLVDLQKQVRALASVVTPGGFVVLFCKEKTSPPEELLCLLAGKEFQLHSEKDVASIFKQERLSTVAKVTDDYNALYLLRRMASTMPPRRVLQVADDPTFQWVEEVKHQLTTTENTIWLVSQESEISGIIGMVNCLKQEPFGDRIRCVFLSDESEDEEVVPFNLEEPNNAHLLQNNLLMNVRCDGAWGTYRHILIREGKQMEEVEHSVVQQHRTGDLSSFAWHESRIKYQPIKQEFKRLAHVYYSSLNFRDIMMTTGKINLGPDAFFGFEFCGRSPDGRRVAGTAVGGCMSTTAVYDERTSFEVPAQWSMEEAATITTVYYTCYYALVARGQLREGDSVLIHSGTGGVGQAALRIATAYNCDIFTTVGNEEKKKYLKEKFPHIKDENIGSSRNTSFETMIMKRTNGKGVDVVLNSLADDKLQASLRCVAMHGKFIEIGKYDLLLDRSLGMKLFLKNITFIGVMVDQLNQKGEDLTPAEGKIVNYAMDLVKKGIEEGVVQPLDRTVFGRDEIEEAIRYMAKGVHVGKVLIKLRDEEPQKISVPNLLKMSAIPETYFYRDKVYIIVGGLGGFGVEVAKWVLRRGGTHIILTSRYGVRQPYHHFCMRRWKRDGHDVRVSTLNVVKKEEAEQLIREAMEIGPVGGIFNSAVVLQDAFMEAQSAQAYEVVCAPKAHASRNLDEASRALCPDLDYFVCFSSISCGRGNAGQSNYGYANSVMERVCERRRRIGLHGLAVQWGIIGEVGVLHRHMGDDAKISGVVAQTVHSCLETLETCLTLPHPVVSSYVTASNAKRATSTNEVLAHISKVMGVSSIDEINTTKSFGEMGIDSMLGVELKQLLETACDATVTFQEIQDMRIDDIKAMLEKAEAEKASGKEPRGPALFSTSSLRIPPRLRHREPVQPIAEGGSGTPLFVLNVGENDAPADFRVLAEALGRPVYALRWTDDTPTGSVDEAARWFLDIAQRKAQGAFQVVGYALSGCFILQMALQSDDVKKAILLDGSDELLRRLGKEAEHQERDTAAVISFLQQFIPVTPPMVQALFQTNEIKHKSDVALGFLEGATKDVLDRQEILEAISLHAQKMALVMNFTPTHRTSKDFVLIEDHNKVFANDVTEIHRLISKVSSGKARVHRIFDPSELSSKEEMKHLATILDSEL